MGKKGRRIETDRVIEDLNFLFLKPRVEHDPLKDPVSSAFTLTGCLMASITVMRDVSLTRDGFPSRASMYLPATPVAFLAE